MCTRILVTYLGLNLFVEQNRKSQTKSSITFDQHLPYLTTLIIDLDMQKSYPQPTIIIYSWLHTPPSVQCIDIGIEIYLFDISLEGFLTSQFKNALDDYNLPSLDKELEVTAVRSLSLEKVVLRLSIKHASFVENERSLQDSLLTESTTDRLRSFPSSVCIRKSHTRDRH